jgi:hypothetical protein
LLDAIMLEKKGIPAVPILTTVFEAAAAEMARLWGVPGFRFVMMPHPLATLTPEGIAQRGASLVEPVVGLLRRGQIA